MSKQNDRQWKKGKQKPGYTQYVNPNSREAIEQRKEAYRRRTRVVPEPPKPLPMSTITYRIEKPCPEGVRYRDHQKNLSGTQVPATESFVGWAGLKELPASKWSDRDNPPWTGPSDWPWWEDVKNTPEDFRDPRRDL
jgi:hypothetical protein